MNDYQRELDQLDFAYKRYTNTVAGLEAVEANIHRTRKVTLADMQKLERLIPGNTYSNQTLAVAGLCSNTRQDEVTAALEAINWKKVGILGLIAAIIGAIIALIARIRGNSKNVQGAVEKAAEIPKKVDAMQSKIDKDVRQVQAEAAKKEKMARYDDPQDAFENTYNAYADRAERDGTSEGKMVEDGYGGYITEVEQARRRKVHEARQRIRDEKAKANREDDYGSLARSGPLPFGKNKLHIVPPVVDETKMAQLAKRFEQRFPHYGKVSSVDMSTMLGISEAQLSGSEPFQLDAVLAGLMDSVDKFMVDRITEEKSSNALAARRRMIYVVAVISAAKKTKYWYDVFDRDNRIAKVEELAGSISSYQEFLLLTTSGDVNDSFGYRGGVGNVWYIEDLFNESRRKLASPNEVPVKIIGAWAKLIACVSKANSTDEILSNPEIRSIFTNQLPNPKFYKNLIPMRNEMMAMGSAESPDFKMDQGLKVSDASVPIFAFIRDDEVELKARATKVLGNSFSLTEFKLKLDAMEDRQDMFDISKMVTDCSSSLDRLVKDTLTIGEDGKLKNLDAAPIFLRLRDRKDLSGILRGVMFDFNDPANAEATASVMSIHRSMNEMPTHLIMGLSKTIARYSEFLNVMANYKTLLSSEYLAMVEFFRSELMKIK